MTTLLTPQLIYFWLAFISFCSSLSMALFSFTKFLFSYSKSTCWLTGKKHSIDSKSSYDSDDDELPPPLVSRQRMMDDSSEDEDSDANSKTFVEEDDDDYSYEGSVATSKELMDNFVSGPKAMGMTLLVSRIEVSASNRALGLPSNTQT